MTLMDTYKRRCQYCRSYIVNIIFIQLFTIVTLDHRIYYADNCKNDQQQVDNLIKERS